MILLYRREKCVILASNGLALNHERSEWFKGGHKRPVLHIFRGGKVKSRGIVSFSVVCYFISLDPLFSHWFEFIWQKTRHLPKNRKKTYKKVRLLHCRSHRYNLVLKFASNFQAAAWPNGYHVGLVISRLQVRIPPAPSTFLFLNWRQKIL